MGGTPHPMGLWGDSPHPPRPGDTLTAYGDGPTRPWGHLHSLWLTPTRPWGTPSQPMGEAHQALGALKRLWGDTQQALGAPTCPPLLIPHLLCPCSNKLIHWAQPLNLSTAW